MRINVRAALIDVASGRWSMITAKSSENTALSPAVLRQSSDQKQVEKLKAEGYASLAEDLGRMSRSLALPDSRPFIPMIVPFIVKSCPTEGFHVIDVTGFSKACFGKIALKLL